MPVIDHFHACRIITRYSAPTAVFITSKAVCEYKKQEKPFRWLLLFVISDIQFVCPSFRLTDRIAKTKHTACAAAVSAQEIGYEV